MSKSLRRVMRDAAARGLTLEPVHLEQGTLTAADAAAAVGAQVDQIVKSVVLRAAPDRAPPDAAPPAKRIADTQTPDSGPPDIAADAEHVLFLTAGGNRVDPALASGIAGIALEKADAASIRKVTGFAIGGVSPLGHLTPIRAFLDPRILDFDLVWAAAGTPHHMFAIAPALLREVTGATPARFTEM